MGAFNRLIVPNGSSYPKFPTGFESWGQSGKGQFRDAMQVGRTWQENYPAFKYNDEDAIAFLSYINQLYREKTVFEISYYHRRTPFGTISGNMYVWGVSQTGTTIQVSRDTGSQLGITGTLKHGDFIKFANINIVYDITANISSGATSITISPAIYEGGSPANLAVITYTGVTFKAAISGVLEMPSSDESQMYSGLTIGFREVASIV